MMVSDTMCLVKTKRVQYTPSPFAKASLLHLAEVGSLTALQPHSSRRDNLGGFLLLVVDAGTGFIEVSHSKYEMNAGDVAFIDCSESYTHCTDRDLWTIYWAHFDGPALLTIYNKFLSRAGQPVFDVPDKNLYIDTLLDLYNTAIGASYVRDMRVNTILSSLLEMIMGDCWLNKGETSRNKVEEIRLFLENNYMYRVTLEQLAQKFFIERTYLVHMFNRVFGISPIKYLTAIRIRKTKEFLRFTDNRLADIAYKVGFSSEQYLSRVFKSIEGISPREYRMRWK